MTAAASPSEALRARKTCHALNGPRYLRDHPAACSACEAILAALIETRREALEEAARACDAQAARCDEFPTVPEAFENARSYRHAAMKIRGLPK